jgi:chemotaxis protein methyltransferase CheR
MPTEVLNGPTTGGTQKDESQDPVYLRIRDLVYQSCGIYHSEEKLYLLIAACKRRMTLTAGQVNTGREYLDLLTNPLQRDQESRELLNQITIGETCLFRSQSQLNALHNVILPEIAGERSKIGLKRLKVWSAGCSTGEEPYTLAMFLLEEKEKLLKDWTFEIQASDLNDNSIEKAGAGVYGDYALRNTPEAFKRKYFVPANGTRLRVKDDVKARITFTRLNLNNDSRMLFMKGMDLIFCCNVLIYFDETSKKRVVQHFYSNLMPNGCFFLGQAESLFQVNNQFRLVSYADFITLLFAFFVVLYSSSQVDKRKVGRLALAIQVAFQELGVFETSNTKVPLSNTEAIPFANIQAVDNVERTGDMQRFVHPTKGVLGPTATNGSLKDVQAELKKVLAPEIQDRYVQVEARKEGVVVSLREMGFYESGSASMRPSAMNAVDRLAGVVAPRGESLRIEGHTDNIPIHNAHFPSNWELSTARATELVQLFIFRYHVMPSRLSAAGYAEFHPVADNSTAEGRSHNRRIDIVILNPLLTNRSILSPGPAVNPLSSPVSAEPAPSSGGRTQGP